MLIVSFCTDDGHYRKYFDAFRRNCDEMGLEHDVRLIKQRHHDKVWVNCDRPAFILERLEEHQRPLLWMDADTVIHKPFKVEGEFDFAYCLNPLQRNNKKAPTITAGIFGFGNTDTARAFIKTWGKACAQYRTNRISSHTRLDQLRQTHRRMVQQDITPNVTGRMTFYGAKGRLAIPV